MKKRLMILIFIVALSIALVVTINSFTAKIKQQAEASLPFVLKEYQGSVAVYKGDKVLEIFRTVNYNSLPEYDRNQLKDGMVFQNMNEIYSVIEDFDG